MSSFQEIADAVQAQIESRTRPDGVWGPAILSDSVPSYRLDPSGVTGDLSTSDVIAKFGRYGNWTGGAFGAGHISNSLDFDEYDLTDYSHVVDLQDRFNYYFEPSTSGASSPWLDPKTPARDKLDAFARIHDLLYQDANQKATKAYIDAGIEYHNSNSAQYHDANALNAARNAAVAQQTKDIRAADLWWLRYGGDVVAENPYGIALKHIGDVVFGAQVDAYFAGAPLPSSRDLFNDLGSAYGSRLGKLIAADGWFPQKVGDVVGKTVGSEIAGIVAAFLGSSDASPTQKQSSLLGPLADTASSQGDNILESFVKKKLEKYGIVNGKFTDKSEDIIANFILSSFTKQIDLGSFGNFVVQDISKDLAPILISYIDETYKLKEGDGILIAVIDGDIVSVGLQFVELGADFIVDKLTAEVFDAIKSIVSIDSKAELIYATFNSIGGKIIGNYFLPFLGGQIGETIGYVVGSLVFEALNFITGGIFEDIIDTIADWFDGYDSPNYQNNISYDVVSQKFIIGAYFGKPIPTEDGKPIDVDHQTVNATPGMITVVNQLTEAYLNTSNMMLDIFGGRVAAPQPVDNSISYFPLGGIIDPSIVNNSRNFHIRPFDRLIENGLTEVFTPARFIAHDNHSGGIVFYLDFNDVALTTLTDDVGDSARLVRVAIEALFRHISIWGGSMPAQRVLSLWQGKVKNENVDGSHVGELLGNLDTAADYQFYLDNFETINTAIQALPESAFSVGWIATLLRASALGLEKSYSVGYGNSYDAAPSMDDDKIRAGDGADTIYSDSGNDVVRTYAGQDRVFGGDGADTLDLGDGDDEGWGDAGNDTILGGFGNDTITGGAGADHIDGGSGIDTASYFASPKPVTASLDGTPGNGGDAQGDQLFNIEIILGSPYDDHFKGGSGNDTIYGNAGSDTLIGGAGEDRLVGDDPLSKGNDYLDGADGNDTLEGGGGADTIYGGNGNDTVYAGADDDLAFGGVGNDTLFGDDGSDTVDGGDGNDVVYGGSADDALAGGAGDDRLFGDAGNDELHGDAGNDQLFGFDGNDLLEGGEGNDILAGETGDDRIIGGIGDDTITGGPGTDSISGDDGNDHIDAGDGIDAVTGGIGNDTILGGLGDDILSGGEGNDRINAGGGNDGVTGDAGVDRILGYDGDDHIDGGADDDALYGMSGDDTVTGGEGNDAIYGDIGQDILIGGTGDDRVYGGAGNDSIDGGTGNDTLAGDDGNDVMYGDDGNDLIYGDSQPNPNALPQTDAAILALIPHNPGFSTWGLVYSGTQYTLAGLVAASQQMLIINPAKESRTDLPASEALWSSSEIAAMKNSGKSIFGYVDLAKINTYTKMWSGGWTTSGIAAGELTSAAPKWLGGFDNATTRLVDFKDMDWQALVEARIGVMIKDQSFDGTLLDDIGEFFARDAAGLTDGTIEPEQISANAIALRDFVIEIRRFADAQVLERDGYVDNSNRFKLVVNGGPYILADALKAKNVSAVLADKNSQKYLTAIDAILAENYFSLGHSDYAQYTSDVYGKSGLPMLSIDTDQVTREQQIQLYTDAIRAGFMPYATESSAYDVLNDTFLDVLHQSAPSTHNDSLYGGNGNDTIIGGAGNDIIDGGSGDNTAVFSGPRGEYALLAHSDGIIRVLGSDGLDKLTNIQHLQFSDGVVEASGLPIAKDAVSIAAGETSKPEGNGGITPFTFIVSRSGASAGLSSVTYAVAGSGLRPATADDFAGGVLPSGNVSFGAGETTKQITILVAGDTAVETHETFEVTLSSPSAGLVLGTAVATGTIVADDSIVDLAVVNSDTKLPVATAPTYYTGPVGGIEKEFISISPDNINVNPTSDNWFIHTGSGTDGIQAHGGRNVLDGGTGSNFLTGAAGEDTFFLDNRDATVDLWSTVVSFGKGDSATVWGVAQAGFNIAWLNGMGAEGYQGLTMWATAPGKPNALLTLAGYSQADVDSGRLLIAFSAPDATTPYLYVYGAT